MAVNGSHLLEYKHRIQLNKVDTFSISGKVRVHAIGYIPNSVSAFPSFVVFVFSSQMCATFMDMSVESFLNLDFLPCRQYIQNQVTWWVFRFASLPKSTRYLVMPLKQNQTKWFLCLCRADCLFQHAALLKDNSGLSHFCENIVLTKIIAKMKVLEICFLRDDEAIFPDLTGNLS